MTALKKYQRLESLGLWKDSDNLQRREVLVSFGKTSLVISNLNEAPLSHWSLATVTRVNPGIRPAVFTPDAEQTETLEIDDATMIDAIENLRKGIARRRPHPGRLRWIIGLSAAVLIAVTLFIWLPDALARYATGLVPQAQAQRFGRHIIAELEKHTGPKCGDGLAMHPLLELERRVLGAGTGRISVLDLGDLPAAHLPGGTILLDRSIIEDYSGPEVAAGFILIQELQKDRIQPLFRLFQTAGTGVTLRFLADGTLPQSVFADYATMTLTKATPMPEPAKTLARFEQIGTSGTPFAMALGPGPDRDALIKGNTGNSDIRPLMDDAGWVMLQSICSN